MLDPSDQPDCLRPTPSVIRTFGKPTELFPDVIPKHSKVRYDWSKARKSVTPKHDSRRSANASRQRYPGLQVEVICPEERRYPALLDLVCRQGEL